MWNEVLHHFHIEQAHEAIKRFGGDSKTLCLISRGINLVYRFESQKQGYFLRVTHEKLRNHFALSAAIAYLRYLFEAGVLVCEPILSQKGNWIEPIYQGQEIFFAHVCREVPGQEMHFNSRDLSLYHRWGASLGCLHKAALNCQAGKYQYTSWQHSLDELERSTNNS